MNFVILKKLPLILSIISFFYLSNSCAAAFKCVDKKGNTIFQGSPCASGSKERKIELQTANQNISVPNSNCTEACEQDKQTCEGDLSEGGKIAKNISSCQKIKLTCLNTCIDRHLEELDTTENYTYDRELRHKRALEKEARYQAFWKKRDSDREQKQNQKNCRKYQKKLAKLKAQWQRKQRAGWKPKDEEKYLNKIENAADAMKIECQ